jgi:hypothetical protein
MEWVVQMKHLATIIGLLILTGADKPPAIISPPPAPPPAPVVRQPSVWQQIQGPLNRSTGRIVDEPTYQLYRIQRSQDEQLNRVTVQTESERFREERERQLRIAESARQREEQSLRDQPEAVKQSDLRLSTTTLDPSPVAAQATADELALGRLRNIRDKQLTAANQQRLNNLKQWPGDRNQIDAEYQRQVDQIERQFQDQRDAILDNESLPTTQP